MGLVREFRDFAVKGNVLDLEDVVLLREILDALRRA